MSIRQQFLDSSISIFHSQRRLVDRAIAQLTNGQLHAVPHEDGNSIVVQMKHLAGNMRSRWTDFLGSDGEKPDRHRDEEFIDDFQSREELDACWEGGWARLFGTLDSLKREDLERTVTIRGDTHTVIEAVQHQISHYGYHIGQIVQQARALVGSDWQTLSVPRGESETYNRSQGQQP